LDGLYVKIQRVADPKLKGLVPFFSQRCGLPVVGISPLGGFGYLGGIGSPILKVGDSLLKGGQTGFPPGGLFNIVEGLVDWPQGGPLLRGPV